MGGGDSDAKELRSDDKSDMLSSSMVAGLVASPEAGSERVAIVRSPEHRILKECQDKRCRLLCELWCWELWRERRDRVNKVRGRNNNRKEDWGDARCWSMMLQAQAQ